LLALHTALDFGNRRKLLLPAAANVAQLCRDRLLANPRRMPGVRTNKKWAKGPFHSPPF